MRNAYKILVGKIERKMSHGRSGIDGRILLKCITEK
jgi:hypothetical protein